RQQNPLFFRRDDPPLELVGPEGEGAVGPERYRSRGRPRRPAVLGSQTRHRTSLRGAIMPVQAIRRHPAFHRPRRGGKIEDVNESLAPGFLVASPSLACPFFNHSLVLMIE